MKPEYGDSVKVHTESEIFEGILMPRPEIFEKDHTIVKLESGYNVGIRNDRIKKIEIAKKYVQKKAQGHKKAKTNGLPKVAILSFGGTISSKLDYKTGGVYADYTAEDFVDMVPQLRKIADIKAEKVMGIMSEDICPQDWQLMARRITNELNDKGVQGVVITHGTDTLHYSTAAMSFFLRCLNKPVIFTAAQRAIDRGASDAFSNLLCAVNAAARFDGAEVVTCMHGSSDDGYCILNRGTRVRKMHTSRRDAFRPINELPLAKIYEDGKIEVMNDNYKKRSSSTVLLEDRFEPKVALQYIYPGMDPDIFNYYREGKFRGIVLAATALGHVPTINPKYSILKKLKELIDDGIAVVIATQTVYGRVHPYVYSNLRKLSVGLKCIFVEDMLPETAYVKLGWVLSQARDIDEIKEMMLINYSGEITQRSCDRAFLY